MHMLKEAALLLILLHFGQSLPFMELCPDIKVVDEFDLIKFTGKWYEILRVNSTGPVSTKCHSETYTLPDEEFLVVSGEFQDQKTMKYSSIEGLAVMTSQTMGNLFYNIPIVGSKGTISVIDTDYKTYAALHICNVYEIIKLEYFWIVSRERSLKPAIIDKLLSEYKALGGDTSSVAYIDQTNCSDAQTEMST